MYAKYAASGEKHAWQCVAIPWFGPAVSSAACVSGRTPSAGSFDLYKGSPKVLQRVAAPELWPWGAPNPKPPEPFPWLGLRLQDDVLDHLSENLVHAKELQRRHLAHPGKNHHVNRSRNTLKRRDLDALLGHTSRPIVAPNMRSSLSKQANSGRWHLEVWNPQQALQCKQPDAARLVEHGGTTIIELPGMLQLRNRSAFSTVVPVKMPEAQQ